MRFKSVLGAFLFVLLASSIAFVIFIQTKSFGGLVTRIVSDLSRKKLDTAVKIKSFSISVFPPGLEMNKVSVKKRISDVESFEAEFGKIGFYISLIEVEEKKLSFGEIRIVDSSIKVTFPEKDEDLKEIDRALIKKIFEFSDKGPLPIDTLLVENTRIFANHDLLEAKRLKLFKKDGSFIARFHLANIQPSKESDFTLDEVWGDAEISQSDLKIYRLKAQHDVQTLLIKGKVKDYYKLKNSEASLNGEAQLYLACLNRDFPMPEMIEIEDGIAQAGFAISFKNNLLSGSTDLFVQNLKSNVVFADELRTNLSLKNNDLSIDKLSLFYKNQKLSLLEPVIVYNLQNRTYLTRQMKASLEKVELTNALRVLPSLSSLHGSITGEIAFSYKNEDLYFTPKNNFVVQNLGLIVGTDKDPFTVLMIKKAVLNDSQFAVINGEFQMSSSIQLARSKLEVDGFVSKDRVQFNVPDAQVNLEDFGNISNLDVKGAGEISILVNGPIANTVINLKGKTKGFEILGYKLDETEKNISVELGNSEVVINKMESKLGKTNLSGTGTVNWKTAEIALGINSNDANSTDLEQILHPIFKDLKFLPEDLDFKAKIDVDIFGLYRLADLKIRSKVNFTDLTAYGENINSGYFDISLLDQKLVFKDFDAMKGRGSINGDFAIGLKDKAMKLKYKWENLELTSLNIIKRLGLSLNSSLSGSIAGEGTTDDYLLKLETTAFNTRIPGYVFEDSFTALDIRNDRIGGKVNFLGKMITSDFNISLKKGIASDLRFKFISDNIKPFFIAMFGQHLEAEDFFGKIHFEGSTKFQDGFNDLDLTGTLRNLAFSHPEFNVNYSSKKPDFLVKDSVIQNWNLNIKESDLYVVTKGEGVFGKKVSLVQEVHFNSKLLEILLAPVLSAEGFLRNIVRINGNGTEFDLSVSSKTADLDLSIDGLPIPVNDLNYNIEFADKRLQIQNITTSLDSGSVSLAGDVFFDNNQPDVNLKFIFDKAEIPILGKSAMNITGEGIILGNNYPYSVGGELVLNKAQIINELNEFSSKSAAFSQIRFLPKNQESVFGKLFALNLNIKAENPVRITNSLMDVALKGEVRVFGNPARPRGEGRLFAPVNSSRIFFKNNEYQITSADINFSPKKDISNPDFDIQAVTFISTFKVFPKAYGDLERFNFDLTSEPALPRNSILSLIAFGYTDEIQSSLRSDDQQNLTQVGVGSFVFDRFKITDILNKQFGLQVNLGTVIEQSSTDSLLSGRSQDAIAGQGGALGRTRSATKIELKKRLDEALTLSVSSTMGGSIGQRQSMNLNYGLTRKIQLEGVYELRTNEEGQEDVIDNSIGGDLKFRWTFK